MEDWGAIHRREQFEAAAADLSVLMFSYFALLVRAGFTEDQAMALTSAYQSTIISLSAQQSK